VKRERENILHHGGMEEQSRGRLIALLGLSCGVTVSGIYFNQPLLVEMGRSFHAQPETMSRVAVATQVGYAAGLLLVVPLGDVYERRGMIQRMIWVLVGAMLLTAAAPSLFWLVAASVGVGFAASVTHVMLPIAPEVATRENSGRAVGAVMTGLLLGILLSRTFSGWVGDWLGWRAVFVIAAGVCLGLLVLLRRAMPVLRPRQAIRYGDALRSLWVLVRTQPVLRESATIGGLVFAAFSAFWTMLVFLLESPHYRMGAGVAGTFGVLGAAGASVAPIAGRMADRRGSRWVVSVALGLLIASFGVVWALGYHMAGLIVGVLVMDAGAQANQVGNQTRIFALAHVPGTAYGARSRINTVYMTIYFAGGAAGSFLAAWAWSRWRWPGVCRLALGLLGLALLRHVAGVRTASGNGDAVGREESV
jgi:predicted MFS family arabinose efflux permease